SAYLLLHGSFTLPDYRLPAGSVRDFVWESRCRAPVSMSDNEMEVEEQQEEQQAGPSKRGNKSGKRFEIKKWNAVAMWSWAICTDTCAICRNNLYEPSIEYQANPTGDPDHPGLSIAWGVCGHVFHLDCIQRWLKTRSACPLCNKEWEFAKIEKILPGGGAMGLE
ncbi:hypothetical protein Agub_g11634, partial [Astrephomene gubernaculifera]